MVSKQWHLAHGRQLELGATARIMGVLNVTPDSFSDGGRFGSLDRAVEQAQRMIEEGADIIDVGGETTKPGSHAISASEEQMRVLPVIEALAGNTDGLISIDTYRADTARLAVSAGAHIVNDIWGLQKEPDIATIAAETRAGLVIMHNGRGRTLEQDAIADQIGFLQKSLRIAREAGVASDSIVLDPGFGFAKETTEMNLDLMARLEELHTLGFPLLVGTSRKRFIGTITGREPNERDVGTAATSVLLRLKGASVFRVHNVAFNRDALKMVDAIMATSTNSGIATA
ncbi:MAG: dihydropteroate synthase [Rhizobiaceae bacterium]|nr:dihydropteroate synthase [Rhizobiaceae bacterium]